MQQHGFTLVRETTVTELAGTARLWRHDATGGELLSFTNADENKVFGVSFRTPPADSTGVAHILEHSVLCGSQKYPVKEPFVELLKGSLQTFLNAFTYPDKTCYPVASANLADFRNLTDVYLDAVFFPRITEAIFQQEGWHLEAEEENSPLTYKGVVYNEMKGAFSSPESVLGRHCLHALFPDTVYGLESGGDPKDIPSLTYEAFFKFHADYYHPSNARFFFWGDDPEEERLAQVGAVLAPFSALKIDSHIPVQPLLAAPRTVTVPFAASAEDDKGMAVMNWLGPEVTDIELGLGFRMLEHILLGMPASPLRRALIESGLGEDIAGQGLETELRQLTFDVGLKGMDVKDSPTMEALILSTLTDLADKGLPPDSVEAAVNSIEFALRENNSGRFPVGLSVMLRALTTWLHEADPLAPLAFETPLAAIKKRLADGEPYFEGIIRQWFLDNTHRVTVILTPDTGLEEADKREEADRLAAIDRAMSPAEKRTAVATAKALRLWQGTPDTPEALAAIPRLGVGDLPRANALIPTIRHTVGAPLFFHPLPTAGIVYADVCFDLAGVPEPLLPLLPLFGRALLEMGTTKRDFVDLNMGIARKTGGMDADTFFLSHARDARPVARLCLSGKVAPDKVADMFGLMREVLTECAFNDKERFLAMVLEEKARQEHGIIPSGHMVVASRLRASLSPAGRLSEATGGIEALFALRALVTRVEKDWESVLADLIFLQNRIVTRSGLALNITALPKQEEELCEQAAHLASLLPQGTPRAPNWQSRPPCPAEALLMPAQVNYVGKGINLFASGYRWHGSASVIMKYLRTGYLWDRVRVQGGAYGCVCALDRMNGAFFMVSYRDPNILPTLEVYDAAARHLAGHRLGKEELDAAIVGAIGEVDTYLLPDAKGSAAFTRHLSGDTVERRQQLRDEILSTTARDINAFGEALEAFSRDGIVCALGGGALESVAQDQGWERTKIM